MVNNNLVLAEQFCSFHNIPMSFINDIVESGLIEITIIENSIYLEHNVLHNVEKIIRLHFDLGVNIEGIEVIENLLQKMQELQQELKTANNKLQQYNK